MNLMTGIGLIVVAFFCLLFIDFSLGRKHDLSKSNYIKYPHRRSNFHLFIDGETLYDDLFECIKKSTHSIHILFFIVRNDDVSEEFLSLLGEKASQGIEVRLLVDYLGGHRLKKKSIKLLKEKGVSFSYTHTPKFPFFFYTLQARNHRKITVIDGEVAYLGGFNIGREYIGKDPTFGFWRDYHLKLTGEGVLDLQQQFLKDWFESTGKHLIDDSTYFPQQPEGKSDHKFISTYGKHLEGHIKTLIKEAKQEIIICSPYFIPGRDILNDLLTALDSGIKVRIMVPMKKDHPLVKEASFPYLGRLIEAGCEIYRFYHGFYHAKVIVIDDRLCDIGTANFDKRSFYLNDEINCVIYDKEFILYVKELIYKDFHKSELFTHEAYQKRPLSHRIKEVFASMVSYFL